MRPMFLSSVPERIIMDISENNNYVSRIMRSLRVTYSHTVAIVQKLENEKIITKTKIGRKTIVELTEKGKKLQYHLKSMRDLL